ncbi:sugar ABC transporter ATP-binding protein [Labrys sp. WJW]|uniref:ABC transporter ATP-binding protein n=1 Tax=Labrys sp. WJW TaxID=1737983 RepID=UPI00082F33AC|nr:sn-glycerol-3-phosphate ABC transporter ATP-binding protein UgpC [Labrys sp. WJW]OCC05528.1 sugar ABC transporter ATP-binding protein [Labrys sp. WJW]
MAEVSLQKVVKVYDGLQTVHGIDLDIAEGELVVLVGPSGCGKSTTLRMVAGLEQITTGEIRIGGVRVNELEPGERDVAMVFQNYALYPHLSVADNIAFGLKLRKTPREEIRRRVGETAEILEITALLDRKPRQLSGGQRQRVAMGRALIRNPKVFLFDEPLSNLDAKLRVQMRAEIKQLHARVPTTTIYVTHDQVEAMTLADRVVVMNKGRIEQVAPPQDLYLRPATVFVAGFIGSPGMNFIPAQIVSGNGYLALRLGDSGVLALPPEKAERFSAHSGKKLLAGIRPEHFSLSAPGSNGLLMQAGVIEPLGMETLVHGAIARTQVVARLAPSSRLIAGAPLTLDVTLDNLCLADADTGALIH